jgi:hypothetical protein
VRPKDSGAGQLDVSVRISLDAKMSVEQRQNKIRALPEPSFQVAAICLIKTAGFWAEQLLAIMHSNSGL